MSKSVIPNYNNVISGQNEIVSYIKSRNVVTVTINGNNNLEDYNKWINLGTIPAEYRPSRTINFLGYDNSASTATAEFAALEMSLGTDGRVNVWPFRAGAIPRGVVTYIIS